MHCDLRVLAQSGPLEGSIVVGVDDRTVQVTVSSHCCLLVPEPLGSHLGKISRCHVGNPSGDFGAVDESVEIGQLLSVGQRDVSWFVELKQVIEVLVPGSEHFRLVDLHECNSTY